MWFRAPENKVFAGRGQSYQTGDLVVGPLRGAGHLERPEGLWGQQTFALVPCPKHAHCGHRKYRSCDVLQVAMALYALESACWNSATLKSLVITSPVISIPI